MHLHLTVSEPFGKYAKGAHISDATEVRAVLNGPNRHNVVQRIPSPEHVSGDFHRTDAEIADRDAKVKAQLGVPNKPVKA